MKYLKTFETYSQEIKNIDNVLDKANSKGGISYLTDEELNILKNMGKIDDNEDYEYDNNEDEVIKMINDFNEYVQKNKHLDNQLDVLKKLNNIKINILNLYSDVKNINELPDNIEYIFMYISQLTENIISRNN